MHPTETAERDTSEKAGRSSVQTLTGGGICSQLFLLVERGEVLDPLGLKGARALDHQRYSPREQRGQLYIV